MKTISMSFFGSLEASSISFFIVIDKGTNKEHVFTDLLEAWNAFTALEGCSEYDEVPSDIQKKVNKLFSK